MAHPRDHERVSVCIVLNYCDWYKYNNKCFNLYTLFTHALGQ